MRTVRNSSRLQGGRYLSGGCTWFPGGRGPGGMYLVQGVYLVLGGVPGPGAVPGPGVYLAGGGVPAQVLPPCEQNDWQTGVKT